MHGFRWAGIAFLLAVIAGCGRWSTDDTPRKPRIALIMKSLANEFFATMAEGAREHQRAHAELYSLIVNGIKDERDVGRQVALVDEMISLGVDAIVIAPADSKALVPACRRAQQAGCIVVNIDNKLDAGVLAESDTRIAFVGPDNRRGALLVGRYVAAHLDRGDAVAILEGVPTAYNAQQRRRGFEDATREAGLRVVECQSGQWEMGVAQSVSSAMLNEHPELRALLCSNDSMALGALAAVRAAGRTGQVAIAGFDNISAVQQAIRAGDIMATADQHADQIAASGIDYALQILANHTEPVDKKTPVELITAENISTP